MNKQNFNQLICKESQGIENNRLRVEIQMPCKC